MYGYVNVNGNEGDADEQEGAGDSQQLPGAALWRTPRADGFATIIHLHVTTRPGAGGPSPLDIG